MFDFQYKDCRAIIYDTQTNQTVADTPILDSDSLSFSIAVPRKAFSDVPPMQVSVLIPSQGSLWEYRGSIRRDSITMKTVDIALYKGKEKESRHYVRYALNAPVHIQPLSDDTPSSPDPMEATLVNISRQGCLLRTHLTTLSPGALLQVSIHLGDAPLSLRASVLRMTPIDENTAECGCLFTG